MLTEREFIEWFQNNGVGIGVSLPTVLIERLFRRAITVDHALFLFLGKSCFVPHNTNHLVFVFQDWQQAHQCYSLYATSSTPKA